MASLKAIRTAVKTTLENAIDGLTVYRAVEPVNVLPAVVVQPEGGAYAAMGRGVDICEFDLLVMVEATDLGIAQDELDDYVTGNGARSIRRVVFEANDVGAQTGLGLANTNAQVTGWSGYGGRFESQGIDHIGAVLRLAVSTRGTD